MTFCVKEMKCLLSSVVWDNSNNLFTVGSGDPDAPKSEIAYNNTAKVILSKYGLVVDKNILKMNEIYDNISVEKYVIMPNHVHMMVIINNSGASGSPLPTNNKLSRFIGTLKRFCDIEYEENIWQKGFYDHIIRDENDFLIRWQYIDENPRKWLIGKDEYYT